MSIEFNTIASFATIIATLVAVLGIIVESRRSRISRGLDLLFRLNSDFSSSSMKEKRSDIAKAILKKEKGSTKKTDQDTIENFYGDIIDHFQTIGLLLRKGYLDKELVHAEYFYWLYHYWECLEINAKILKMREYDPTAWEDAEWLYKNMIKYEKRIGAKNLTISKEQIINFLEYESAQK